MQTTHTVQESTLKGQSPETQSWDGEQSKRPAGSLYSWIEGFLFRHKNLLGLKSRYLPAVKTLSSLS